MTAARLGYRGGQKEALETALKEIETLREENTKLKKRIEELLKKEK